MKSSPVLFCFTVDDLCFEGYSSEEHLRRLLDFCAKQELKATLFTVPLAQGKALRERPGYVSILKDAIAAGHEVGQHGLEHDRFEFGIPPAMVLALSHEGPARERLKNHRAEIEKELAIAPLRRRLARGRDILKQALGLPIQGFRGPCLSICDNLFHALEAERFVYDSSRHMQPGGWDLLNRGACVPSPITRKVFDSLQYAGSLRVLPLTAEYTWYLKPAMFDATLKLAIHDFDACMDAGIPFVPICHVSPIREGEEDCGFKLYRELIRHAQERAAAAGAELRMLTLSEACQTLPALARSQEKQNGGTHG